MRTSTYRVSFAVGPVAGLPTVTMIRPPFPPFVKPLRAVSVTAAAYASAVVPPW